ncbi:uncharacterized protein YALI1_A08941g [Yarrowia lipolytica]|uniref:Uncharacterized protein n=1 Tax=Yarrowia lipolytica TaxID=4952 RepID=A0A1D8N470_YARLL|nr:hypothetical protein YALI1_A08941g [Yarrowia lipolytica]
MDQHRQPRLLVFNSPSDRNTRLGEQTLTSLTEQRWLKNTSSSMRLKYTAAHVTVFFTSKRGSFWALSIFIQ